MEKKKRKIKSNNAPQAARFCSLPEVELEQRRGQTFLCFSVISQTIITAALCEISFRF